MLLSGKVDFKKHSEKINDCQLFYGMQNTFKNMVSTIILMSYVFTQDHSYICMNGLWFIRDEFILKSIINNTDNYPRIDIIKWF